MKEEGNVVGIRIADNGRGLPENFGQNGKTGSLGLQLIEALSHQLGAEYSYGTRNGETLFSLDFEKQDVRGAGNALLN